MQLFAPAPDGGDEVRRVEHIQPNNKSNV
jgi:hypothetical protein